ncbi:L-aspartate oxidase [Dermacoccaceae bacterium W4C1]
MRTPVVLGSGLAGLTTALRLAAEGEVVLATAGSLSEHSSSSLAQGGIAAALDPADSPAAHAEDTWRAGAGAGDRATIERITAAAPHVVRSLDEQGVGFDRDAHGELDLALEGGHSAARIAHVGDHTGAAVTAVAAQAVAAHPRIRVLEQHRATEILLSGAVGEADSRVSGVLLLGPPGSVQIATDRLLVATGGLASLFGHTTNPLGNTGSGIALAARAGARTQDLHLVQFHPTALDAGVDPAPLLTEALRGAGAALLADGERFVDELQPRDVVAAAVWHQASLGRRVLLDATGVPEAARRFPTVAALLATHGLSLDQPVPVRPAAHYSMGGISVDADARSSLRGLWAVGEASRTGLHGANRLASNSLLEAVVTAEAAASCALAYRPDQPWDSLIAPAEADLIRPRGPQRLDREQIRAALDTACGVLREGTSLAAAVALLDEGTGSDEGYLAWLIARSALGHPHSIGAHRRTDEAAAVSA